MPRKCWMCGACKKAFATERAVRDHIKGEHRKRGHVGVFQMVGSQHGLDYDDEPSMAELAVEAEIDRAMGIPNDDDWMLP